MSTNISVFGLYPSVTDAETAVDQLIGAGFAQESISVLSPKTPEGTVAGVAAGAMIGGTLGVLAGITMLAIPGLGPLIVAGPILGALAGAGVGGAASGLIATLVDMGLSEQEAKHYEGRIKEGAVFVCAHCDTAVQLSRAKEILLINGAEEIWQPTF